VGCDVARVDVKAFARSHHLSLEAAARVCRYRALSGLARKSKAEAILTAHTLDDQAETVMINLLRGCGTLGLCGIWERSLFPGARIPVIRPLLGVRRQALRAYLKSIRQGYREDATNRSPVHLRNWVRHMALPLLRKSSPSLDEHLARLSSILQFEEQWWKRVKSRVDMKGFLRYPIAVQRRFLREALPLEPSFDTIESLRARPTRFQSPPPNFLDCSQESFFRSLKVPGVNRHLPQGWRLTARVVRGQPGRLDQSPWTACLDWSAVKNSDFVWRSWCFGDRFQPQGMRGEKKVSDFFCDEKIPGSVKGKVPLIEADGRLVWLVGFRLADPVKVIRRTQQTLILSVKKEL
jgi:tRNA(Ile)-lysidine synthase